MDIKNGKAVFVIPHWRNENVESKKHLDETIDVIFNQTDPNWHIVIVDDVSPCKEAVDYLDEIKAKAPEKVTIIKGEVNAGPGHCRNVGIKWAYDNDCPFICFIDVDDLCTTNRVEVARKIFAENAEASVVYSTFKVIDEDSNEVEWDKLSGSIQEIIEGHQGNPPQGPNAWIEIGTEKGYTNLTSATTYSLTSLSNSPSLPKKYLKTATAGCVTLLAARALYIAANAPHCIEFLKTLPVVLLALAKVDVVHSTRPKFA
jgi:hypothetical protein